MRDLLKHSVSLCERLNSPFLVERIQNYYGVHRLPVVKNGHRASSNGVVNGGDVKRCSFGADTSVPCRVDRRLWYYVFRFGSLLGYEAFYASFFPFILWNWDAVVCRRVLFVWAPVMYFGGLAKDLLRWPRPASPPVVQFDRAYAAEFGMPSTHAMTGASVPFGLLLFTQQRYDYSLPVALAVCLVWCLLLCVSRLYLGMHTVLDILVGLVLAWALLFLLSAVSLPAEAWLLLRPWGAPLAAALLLYVYPAPPRWTPARGDTCLVVTTVSGIWAGQALLPHLGLLHPSPPPADVVGAASPYAFEALVALAFILARTTVGLAASVIVRTLVKAVTYPVLCALHGCDPRLESSRQKGTIELPCKYITYLSMGLTMSVGAPWLYHQLGIHRTGQPTHL